MNYKVIDGIIFLTCVVCNKDISLKNYKISTTGIVTPNVRCQCGIWLGFPKLNQAQGIPFVEFIPKVSAWSKVKGLFS